MEKSEFVPLRAFTPPWYLGTRHMATRRERPVAGPEDLRGLRMRVGDGSALPA